MKRIGNLYEKVYDIENLKKAHKNASKGKGWYEEVKWVNEHLDECLYNIQQMLINKTFKTSEYEVFYKQETTKLRKIYKLPYYPDRIVQWAILQVIEPYLMRNFTADTYSAIPGRGIHLALKNMQKALYTDSENCQYCLKFDIRHYYQSIDHEMLKQDYTRLFKDKDLLWIISEVIDSINTADEEDLIRLDSQGQNVGVPIGNYMSQYSGNIYLSKFDHWLKEVVGIKYYFRYMDDCVILARTKDELRTTLYRIKNFLWIERKLTLKPNWQIFPTYIRGIDFVGYRVFKKFTLLRKTTCINMKRKMAELKYKRMINYSDFCSYNSYAGLSIWCDSYRLNHKYTLCIHSKAMMYYNNVIKKGAIA